MKTIKYISISIIIYLTSCKGQDKDGVTYPKEKIMNTEKFNIEKFNECLDLKNKPYNDFCKQVLVDSTVKIQAHMGDHYREDIIPAPPHLIKKVKLFYLKTGIIKQEYETYIGRFDQGYGTSKYYDEKGYLIKTVDENIKYKDIKIKLHDLFEILKREPLLDKLSYEEKENFNFYFSLGKESKDVTLQDIFKYLN